MIPAGTLTLTGLGTTIAGLLAKLGWKTVQSDRQTLRDIKDELAVQRLNCLTTLQNQSREQVELLGKINDNLVEVKGFLEGSARK